MNRANWTISSVCLMMKIRRLNKGIQFCLPTGFFTRVGKLCNAYIVEKGVQLDRLDLIELEVRQEFKVLNASLVLVESKEKKAPVDCLVMSV